MMREGLVKIEDENPRRPTRRDFLKASAASVLGCALPAASALAMQASRPAGGVGASPPDYTPNWLLREPRRSRVVDISSTEVLQASVINPFALEDLLSQGLLNLTGEQLIARAWRAVLGDARKIVLKFNSVGADVLKTNDPLAKILVEQLVSAGWDSKNLALVEVPDFIRKETGSGTVTDGWLGSIAIADDAMPVRQYLSEADAIINIPLLKTHQIAGMSCCMKNLSHAVIRHPARCHGDGCSPYVGQIVGTREVSSKIKLNIVNALRIVIDHGPDAREDDIVDYGGLIFGYDPLTLDTLGLSMLEMERRRIGRPGAMNVRYLIAAAEMNLGRWRVSDIERLTIKAGA